VSDLCVVCTGFDAQTQGRSQTLILNYLRQETGRVETLTANYT